MKLTEAQLTRIIEEEVQRAIDEGIFDRIKSAVGSFAGGAKKTGDAGQEALDAGLSSSTTAYNAFTDALYAARRNPHKKLIYRTSDMVNKLANLFEELVTKTKEMKKKKGMEEEIKEINEALLSYFDLLSKVAGMNLSTLGEKVRSSRRIDAARAALAGPPSRSRSGYDPTGAVPTRDITAKAESKIRDITEAIMKRISQKR
jgi:hypothetical protein